MNLATTTQFLRDNPNNYIELVRLDTQQSLPFDGNKGVYISDIPAPASKLTLFLNSQLILRSIY